LKQARGKEGIILGIAFQLPLFMINIFPWFPDIYGWKVNTCSTGAWYVTADSPLASLVGLATFQKNPLYAAIFYMAPLNVLFGAWLLHTLFEG